MTTIAYRNRVMASDSLGVHGTFRLNGPVRKMWNLHDGSIVGGAGLIKEVTDCIHNAETYKDIKLPPSGHTSFLHVEPSGFVRYLGNTSWIELGNIEYCAIGSGREIAFGAFDHGATAEEAILSASRYDIYTDNNVVTMTFNDDYILPDYPIENLNHYDSKPNLLTKIRNFASKLL